jgi:hypothetical protein
MHDEGDESDLRRITRISFRYIAGQEEATTFVRALFNIRFRSLMKIKYFAL